MHTNLVGKGPEDVLEHTEAKEGDGQARWVQEAWPLTLYTNPSQRGVFRLDVATEPMYNLHSCAGSGCNVKKQVPSNIQIIFLNRKAPSTNTSSGSC